MLDIWDSIPPGIPQKPRRRPDAVISCFHKRRKLIYGYDFTELSLNVE